MMKKSTLTSAVITALAGMVSLSTQANLAPVEMGSPEVKNVHNNCIVQFNDGLARNNVEGVARELSKNAQASVKHIYKNSIKGMTLSMPCHAAEKAFANHPNVKSFTPDSIVTVSKGKPGGGGSASQSTPWSVTRVGGAQNGAGYTAWVIDTGIDVDHADLNVDASRGFSAFTKGRDAGVDDGDGHGTHVAGTIAAIDNTIDVVGVAAGATVIPVKVLDSRGSGTTSGVIAGIDWVAQNASPGDCANMSLGGGASSALDDAIKAAAQQSGAYFVVAAGNDGSNASNYSPARANGNNIWTISATDANDRMASWSNYGNPPVDYAAPGVSILSLKNGGGTTTMSGTSMASPAACAVIMLKNGNPSTDGKALNDPDGNADSIIHL